MENKRPALIKLWIPSENHHIFNKDLLSNAKKLFIRIGNVTDVIFENIYLNGNMSYIIFLDDVKTNVYATSILDKTIKKINSINSIGTNLYLCSVEILKNDNDGVPIIYANLVALENEEIQELKLQILALKSQAHVLENEEIQELKLQILALKSQVQALELEIKLRKEITPILSARPKKSWRW
jgi:hypothetical protein